MTEILEVATLRSVRRDGESYIRRENDHVLHFERRDDGAWYVVKVDYSTTGGYDREYLAQQGRNVIELYLHEVPLWSYPHRDQGPWIQLAESTLYVYLQEREGKVACPRPSRP